MPATYHEKGKALVAAVTSRSFGQVRDSLSHGADVHYENDLPLRSAVYLGYTEMAEELLGKGANVHVDDEMPLFIAIKAKDAPLIDLLLAKGADAQALLDKRRAGLTDGDMKTVAEIKSRAARRSFEKNATVLRNVAQAKKRVVFKPLAP